MDGTAGPRTGNFNNRDAHAELGETGILPLTFSADFFWTHGQCRADAFFVVLSDDPATSLQVPTDGSSTASPINAIAWGHAATGNKDYSFFDGQNWTLVGYSDAASETDGEEVMHGTVDAAGNWWGEVIDPTSENDGLLAVSDFSFDTVSIISVGNDSGHYSGLDNIEVEAAPEPASLSLLALGGLVVARRRR
jgi:hypothetical protein